jgi:hypothetical protein
MDKLIILQSQAYEAIEALERTKKILAELNMQIGQERLRRQIQGERDGEINE